MNELRVTVVTNVEQVKLHTLTPQIARVVPEPVEDAIRVETKALEAASTQAPKSLLKQRTQEAGLNFSVVLAAKLAEEHFRT
jgi:hypothetical protein